MFGEYEIVLNTDFHSDREYFFNLANKVLYTGAIDELFDYCYGELEYRSLSFKTEILETDNLQGVAVMNFTDLDTPYTRRIEHKHFKFGKQPKTVVTYEYPTSWERGVEPYYPINDEYNQSKYDKYKKLAEAYPNLLIGGRLGEYKYYDMQDTILSAMTLVEKEFSV